MSPGRREWIERMIPQWSARAAALRTEPGRGAAVRASGVQDVVDRLSAELDAARGSSMLTAHQLARLATLDRLIAADRGPYPHSETGVMINAAPFLDNVYHQLRCEAARLRGERCPDKVTLRSAVPQPAPLPPPPEAIPFTAGPQLALFEFAS